MRQIKCFYSIKNANLTRVGRIWYFCGESDSGKATLEANIRYGESRLALTNDLSGASRNLSLISWLFSHGK